MKPAVSFQQIVWPLAVAETLVWAALFYSFPALLLEWESDFGWARTEIAVAFSLTLVASAVFAPIVGRGIDRGFGKWIFTGSAAVGALLLVLLTSVSMLWQFYALWIALGMAMSGCLYEACFAILTRTLGSQAKRAITLVTLVAGFAGTVSFPGIHFLMERFGWRTAIQLYAVVVLGVAVPLIWWGCRGMENQGEGTGALASPKTAESLQILKNPAFWFLGLAFAAFALDHGVLLTHILPLLNERGLAPEMAVFAASMMGPMQVVGRLMMVGVERHVSAFFITAACFIALALAALSLIPVGSFSGLVVVFVLLHGAGNGVASIMRPVITAELLGQKNFGVISGLIASFFIGAMAAAPTISALVWEWGGYDWVIWLAFGAAALGLFLYLGASALTRNRTSQ